MHRGVSINLGNLILSLSDAMDLASPFLVQHQQRTAYIVWEMCKLARLSDKRLENSFIAALLHDIGAFSLEEKIALHNYEVRDKEEHCIRGEILLERIPWLREPARIMRFHHMDWQDWTEPIETPLALESQMLHIADYLERRIDRSVYILHQNEGILADIIEHRGSYFHPDVVDLLLTVSGSEEFWLDLMSPRLYSLLLHEGPYRKLDMGIEELIRISELFRSIIDFRSRFTATHSSGVAAAASILSRIFGLTEMEIRLMEVAGNLHDLGKLVIPNGILDKPGKLDREEMAIMKSHTYFTYSVLNTIGGFREIAEWAAYHHEKLDGSGYPFHCKAGELSTGARIMMAADIFTALAEDRPYRKGMSENGIIQIMKQFQDRKLLDPRIISLLFDNYSEISSHVSGKQAEVREFYENQFAFLK
ncbi:MAG: HD domain-containing protein [Nitrospirae bacterium]|nr:HD domain-containing protein [Nitrospirota bacterium]